MTTETIKLTMTQDEALATLRALYASRGVWMSARHADLRKRALSAVTAKIEELEWTLIMTGVTASQIQGVRRAVFTR